MCPYDPWMYGENLEAKRRDFSILIAHNVIV